MVSGTAFKLMRKAAVDKYVVRDSNKTEQGFFWNWCWLVSSIHHVSSMPLVSQKRCDLDSDLASVMNAKTRREAPKVWCVIRLESRAEMKKRELYPTCKQRKLVQIALIAFCAHWKTIFDAIGVTSLNILTLRISSPLSFSHWQNYSVRSKREGSGWTVEAV